MTGDRLPVLYACIWRASEPDATFDAAASGSRIPRLMTWLRDLRARGKLAACAAAGSTPVPAG